MDSFSELNLSPSLATALKQMGYETPTPIQAQAVPLALEGKDVLGTAQTGTGKTGAFGIPLIEFLLKNPSKSAMVLTPTRELAMQVAEVLDQMTASQPGMRSALLIGGTDMKNQERELTRRPRIIVGTPGRIIDHLKSGKLMLFTAGFFVLDEMDRMLDMGFIDQIQEICRFLPPIRQTLMFSATLPPRIEKFSAKFMKSPERVSIGAASRTADLIEQDIFLVRHKREKMEKLTAALKKAPGPTIVFVNTKAEVNNITETLLKKGFQADYIHSDRPQSVRMDIIEKFRNRVFNILVATDVASRGLDISHIENVINYDLPPQAEDFVHRIGRTGRAGAAGYALTLLTKSDEPRWQEVLKLIGSETAKQLGNPFSGSPPPSRKTGGKPEKQKHSEHKAGKEKPVKSSPKKPGKPATQRSESGHFPGLPPAVDI